MIKFGLKNEFELWVDYFYIKYKNNPEYIEALDLRKDNKMWGNIYLWVNGKNIFAFKDRGPEATYTSELSVLIEFFCDNFKFHLSEELFPVQTKAKNAVDMMEETSLVPAPDNDLSKYLELDWDKIDMNECQQIDEWSYHHGFLANNGGSFLPKAYIRRDDNKIEISWNNEHTYYVTEEGKIFFEHTKGCEYIDLKLYKDVISQFCLDFIDRFYDLYPENMERNKQNLLAGLKISDE